MKEAESHILIVCHLNYDINFRRPHNLSRNSGDVVVKPPRTPSGDPQYEGGEGECTTGIDKIPDTAAHSILSELSPSPKYLTATTSSDNEIRKQLSSPHTGTLRGCRVFGSINSGDKNRILAKIFSSSSPEIIVSSIRY